MIVAIIGNDGTGKSTLVRELAQRCEAVGVTVSARHGYEHPIFGLLLRHLGQRAMAERQQAYLDPGAPRTLWMRLWPMAVWLECLLMACKHYLCDGSRVLLYDRYAYDQLASFEHLGCGNRLARWLILRLPRPHVLVLLQAPPLLACRRKGEDPDEQAGYHIGQQRRYDALAAELHLQPLRTDQPLPEVVDEVWRRLQARWPAAFGSRPAAPAAPCCVHSETYIGGRQPCLRTSSLRRR